MSPAPRSRGRRIVAAVLPPPGVQKALVLETLTYAIGNGFYAAGSIIFFTVYVGLSAAQIALGMSIAGLLSFAFRVPFGMLADRIGGKTGWLLGALGQAVFFGSYPLIRGFREFVVVISLVGLAASLGSAGRSRYLGEVIPDGSRVKVNAYLRSVLNSGYAIGTAAAGFLVAIQSRGVIAGVVLANAASFGLDVLLLARFLAPPERSPGPTVAPAGQRKDRRVFRDRPFIVLSGLNGIFVLSDVVLTVVLPLWILQATHLPRPVIPAVLLINMLIVVLLQTAAAKGAEDIRGAARRQREAAWFFAAGCLILPFTLHAGGRWAVAAIILAVVSLSVGEIRASAGSWGLSYGLSPAQWRGEYLAVYAAGGQLGGIVGPAAMTAVALSLAPGGWILIGAVFLFAGSLSGPVAAWATRARMEEPQWSV